MARGPTIPPQSDAVNSFKHRRFGKAKAAFLFFRKVIQGFSGLSTGNLQISKDNCIFSELQFFQPDFSKGAISAKFSCGCSLLMFIKNVSSNKERAYLWISCFLFLFSVTWRKQKHVEPTRLLLHMKWG